MIKVANEIMKRENLHFKNSYIPQIKDKKITMHLRQNMINMIIKSQPMKL